MRTENDDTEELQVWCGWYTQDAKHDYPFLGDLFIISFTKDDGNMAKRKKGRENAMSKMFFSFSHQNVFDAYWNGEKYKTDKLRSSFCVHDHFKCFGISVGNAKATKRLHRNIFLEELQWYQKSSLFEFIQLKDTHFASSVVESERGWDFSHHTNGIWYRILWRHGYTPMGYFFRWTWPFILFL